MRWFHKPTINRSKNFWGVLPSRILSPYVYHIFDNKITYRWRWMKCEITKWNVPITNLNFYLRLDNAWVWRALNPVRRSAFFKDLGVLINNERNFCSKNFFFQVSKRNFRLNFRTFHCSYYAELISFCFSVIAFPS